MDASEKVADAYIIYFSDINATGCIKSWNLSLRAFSRPPLPGHDLCGIGFMA
jgi:hypothetical protein